METKIFSGMLCLLVLTMINIPAAIAGFSGAASTAFSYDDNIYRLSGLSPSIIYENGLRLAYFPDSSAFGLGYSVDLTSFGQFPERYFHSHTASASYEIALDQDEKSSLKFNLSGTGRFDSPDLEYSNYYQAQSLALYQLSISETMSTMIGYKFRLRDYPSYGDMSFAENYASGNFSISLPSKTSLILNIDIGLKSFLSGITMNPFDQTITGVNNISQVETGPGGNGKKGNDPGNNLPGSQQLNYQTNRNYLRFIPSLQVGQSIFENTGISLLISGQLIGSGSPYFNGMANDYTDFDLFDDPYSYESADGTVQLTQILPWDITMTAAGFYSAKQYIYKVQNEDGSNPARFDRLSGLSVSFEKTLDLEFGPLAGLNLYFGYYYLTNESNVAWYSYKSNNLMLSLTANF